MQQDASWLPGTLKEIEGIGVNVRKIGHSMPARTGRALRRPHIPVVYVFFADDNYFCQEKRVCFKLYTYSIPMRGVQMNKTRENVGHHRPPPPPPPHQETNRRNFSKQHTSPKARASDEKPLPPRPRPTHRNENNKITHAEEDKMKKILVVQYVHQTDSRPPPYCPPFSP